MTEAGTSPEKEAKGAINSMSAANKTVFMDENQLLLQT